MTIKFESSAETMNIEITPTTAADVAEFFPKASPWRIRALTTRVDGRIVGIGGYAILPNGVRFGFMQASEEDIRQYPVVLYRATRKFFEDIQEAGVTRFTATADKNREAAPRWLERLGFTFIGEIEGESVFQWQ